MFDGGDCFLGVVDTFARSPIINFLFGGRGMWLNGKHQFQGEGGGGGGGGWGLEPWMKLCMDSNHTQCCGKLTC